jgi:cell wall-associated NlpC family hydrolase
MMEIADWYFAAPERQAQLSAEAARWLGTPFAHRGAVPGAGVDCVQLVGQLMCACGVAESYEFGDDYPLDWSMHSDRSLIAEYIDRVGCFERLEPTATAMPGDIAGFRIGLCIQHAGVMLGPRDFIHVIAGRRTVISRIDDATWGRRLECYWRATS